KISGANIIGPTGVLIAGKSSANLTCQAANGTLISMEWLKDGHPLSPSNRITFSGDNSSVSIDPVQGTDNGQYQCTLTNPVSTDAATYKLTVNSPLTKLKHMSPNLAVTAMMIQQLLLFCLHITDPSESCVHCSVLCSNWLCCGLQMDMNVMCWSM
ncbi:hypothetical protein SKAU_G00223310, partial [Synaphobranchus kaupii]